MVQEPACPQVGLTTNSVHYERVFAETANLARDDGADVDGLFFVAGARIMF